MKLGHFLDAGYALLVEEYQRLGTDLTTTLQQLSEWRAGGPPEDQDTEVPVQQKPVETATARQNAQALAELQSMMAGVGKLG